MKYDKLVQAARKAKQHSLSPYSKFRVGAALRTESGKIFIGCNIENSSFSLTMCAERTALYKAISEGYRRFTAIAISSDVKKPVPPCGACRQVIMELAGDVDIILANDHGSVEVMKMSDLLPHPFDSSFLHTSKK